MRMVYIFFLTLFSVSTAAGSPIKIRSGDHPSFTRITIELPLGLEWKVEPGERRIHLTFSDEKVKIDLRSAFQRIARRRISSIEESSKGNALVISLGCNCGYRVFMATETLLVIDVDENLRNRERISSSGFASSPPQDKSRITLPVLPTAMFAQSPRLTGFSKTSELLRSTFEDNNYLGNPIGIPNSKFDTDTRNKVSTVTLMELIDKASSKGLLTPSHQTEIDPNQIEMKILESINVRLATQTPRGSQIRNEVDEFDVSCPAHDLFSISSWGHPNGFSDGLADWSRKLINDLDRPDDESIIGMARLYLHYGLGVEAEATIDLNPSLAAKLDSTVIKGMARALESHLDPTSTFSKFSSRCKGPATLWSLLSIEEEGNRHDLDLSELLIEFEALPNHIRNLLGRRLVTNLSRIAEYEVASLVINSIPDNTSRLEAETSLRLATLNLNEEDNVKRREAMLLVIEEMPPGYQNKLTEVINAALRFGDTFTREELEEIEALVLENRDTSDEQEFGNAYALALAITGQYAAAFDYISQAKDPFALEDLKHVRSKILKRLASHADDGTFISLAIPVAAQNIDPHVSNLVADRLLKLGFPELAQKFLIGKTEGAAERERQILRAKVALELKQIDPTEAEFLSLFGADADEIRREIQVLRGVGIISNENLNPINDFLRVGEMLLNESGAAVQQAEGRSLGEFFNEIGKADQLSDTQSDYMNSFKKYTLSASRDLLENSQKTREAVLNYLNSPRIDAND
jgi:hypothetical protein